MNEPHVDQVVGGISPGKGNKVVHDMPSLGDQIYKTLHSDKQTPTEHRVYQERDRSHDMPGLGDIIAYSLHPPDPETGKCIVHEGGKPPGSPRRTSSPKPKQ
jgi:hypothetical protein